MADPNGSTGSSRRPARIPASVPPTRSSSFNAAFQRRQSASQRINEILETARERADSMAQPDISGLPRQLSHSTIEENPVDESTGLASSGSGTSYNATGTVTPRSKTSIYRRGSQASGDGHVGSDAEQHVEHAEAWTERVFGGFRSVELENKGSVARDHLALERTFLAWLRTSLAFASIGIAVTQLFRLNTSLPGSGADLNDHTLRHVGRPLGVCFLAISILILLLGYRRYFHAQAWVIQGKFPASRGTVILVSLVAFLIMVASLVIVIVIHRSEDGASRPGGF